jgi:hypothetical protein
VQQLEFTGEQFMAKKKAAAKKSGGKGKAKKITVLVKGKKGKKLHIFGSGDNTPIVIDDGGSLRIKQRNQKLDWDSAGNVVVMMAYSHVQVLQLKFDGTILLNGQDVTIGMTPNFVAPGVLQITTGNGTLTAQPATDDQSHQVTVLTLSKGKPDEKKDDPKKANQYRYISKDKGDVSKITFDGDAKGLVFDDTVSNTRVDLIT